MLKIVLLTCMWLCVIFANPEIPRVKYVPPAYLDKVEVTAYESHTKLIFKVDLPDCHTLLPKEKTCPEGLHSWKSECDTEAAVRDIFTDYYSELLSFNETYGLPRRRIKRQIIPFVVGAGVTLFADSVINMFLHSLFGNEESIVQSVNQLRKSVKEGDEKYFIMEKKVTAFGKAMENFQKIMITRIYDRIGYLKDETSKQISKLYHLLLLKIDHDELMMSISQCRSKEFPIKLVSVKTFINSLKKISEYQMQEASFLASSETRNVLITSHMLPHCSVEEHKLCLIPQFQSDSTQSLSCVVGILNNKPVHELAKFCSFRCASNSELSIKQLDTNRIIVTNSQTIDMKCSGFSKSYALQKLGTVEVLLDCNCTIIIDGKITIDPFYCFTVPESHERVFNAIPTLWTKLDMAYGSHIHTFIDHSNLTMNYNWTQMIPTLNLTPSHITLPEPLVESVFSIVNIWLTVLTLIMFMMFGMLVCMYFTVVRR